MIDQYALTGTEVVDHDEQDDEWPEDDSRMDIIGQNGNDGLIYSERPDLYGRGK